MNDGILRIDDEGKRCFAFGVEDDRPPASDVPLCPMRGFDLAINNITFPAVPQDLLVLVRCFRKPVLAVEEDEDVVAKNGQQVAQLVAVIFVWIGITPQFEEGSLAKLREHSLGICYAG